MTTTLIDRTINFNDYDFNRLNIKNKWAFSAELTEMESLENQYLVRIQKSVQNFV